MHAPEVGHERTAPSLQSTWPHPALWASLFVMLSRNRALLLGLVCAACGRSSPDGADTRAEDSTLPAATQVATHAAAAPAPAAETSLLPADLAPLYAQAQAEIARVVSLPGLPGAPNFERNRAQLVARAKSEPVVFVSTPEYTRDHNPEVIAGRKFLTEAQPAWRALEQLRKKFEKREDVLRKVLLRDGYLYSESPDLAFALVSQVRPRELFKDARIWIQRGNVVMHARPDVKHGYVYEDGPEAGSRVRLLHLDRIGNTDAPGAALHRDVRSARYLLKFEELRVRHLTAEYMVADCRYGANWVPTLFKSDGPKLSVVVEAIAPDLAADVARDREAYGRKLAAYTRLQEAMRAQIDEALPFDEPKTEIGQEDGTLRREWVRAYLRGDFTYKYNDDEYKVFDRKGRPRVPQVCIDFVWDTFERASGTWWLPRQAEKRAKTQGTFQFSAWADAGTSSRQTWAMVKLAESHPEAFNVLHFPEKSRIELGYKARLFRWLGRHVDDFEIGDIILIRGLTPWDAETEHTHAFFIYEVDPITRIPIAIAGNAGPANLWSWETEARRTPHRTIRTRVRPNAEWLASLFPEPIDTLVPPTLVSGFR
jgi:hypothetical protein